MSLGLDYSSDEDEIIRNMSKDAFGLSALPQKKPRVEELSIAPTDTDAAPHVLSEDPLNLKMLVTRPTDTQMNVNIPYEEVILPLQGPENPFADRNRFLNQTALAGHVGEQSTSDHAFCTQHLTHSILGYSANTSLDPNAPAIVGSLEAAEANKFATLDTLRATSPQKRDLKRKRKEKGILDVVDGDGAYVGPWAGWKGEDQQQEFLAGVEASDDEEEDEAHQEISTF